MVKSDAVALRLNDLLCKENELLNVILTEQRLIRESVKTREWAQLDASIYRIQKMSDEFKNLESQRLEVLYQFTGDESLDIYQISHMFSLDLRQTLLESFRLMRQKLSVSKIENNALAEYIRITKDFLQGIFDNAVPQARNTVYSNKGKVIKAMPDSLVLDQIM